MGSKGSKQSLEEPIDVDDGGGEEEEEEDKKMPACTQEEPIDLCDSDEEVAIMNVPAAAMPRRKKRKRDENKSDTGIIGDPLDEVKPDEAYLRALGPQRMEFVDAFPCVHEFQGKAPPTRLPRTLTAELLEYKLNLPIAAHSSIFVRAMEARMDLLRVLISGPVDTPYQHGIYLFDVHLYDYPQRAPKVKFLTTNNGRVRFNPNLYNCGKVCLSLLGTWSGPGWIKGQSTLLQVLVSIQALILVKEPYFNEPGYERQQHQPQAQKASDAYSKNIRRQNLQVAILAPLRQVVESKYIYAEFQDVVKSHFDQQSDSIRTLLKVCYAQDKSLKQTVESIESLLDQLHAMMHKEPETIELLDD